MEAPYPVLHSCPKLRRGKVAVAVHLHRTPLGVTKRLHGSDGATGAVDDRVLQRRRLVKYDVQQVRRRLLSNLC